MKTGQISLIWEGSQFESHSLAKVNRNICKHLCEHENIDLHIESFENDSLQKISSIKTSLNAKDHVTVYHQWPPNWTSPDSKYWICMQPWEFGAVPKQWYIPMKYWTDEIWVYSTYNKECYVRCGIPGDKIKVIPLGVDETIYHYHVKPLAFKDKDPFHFLFVGGTIIRKGIDTLLQAYLQEFSPDEDVCLVIKDFGTHSFYKGITSEKIIAQAASDSNQPRILYLNKEFSEQDMAGLYKACDCLVLPYRGEGFGLPIIEAMACGTPAIIPNLGPSQDFCDAETAFLLPCEEERLEQKQIDILETVDNPWWLKINQTELQKMMRFVYENRSLVKEKGKKASEKIGSTFTWKQTANVVSDTVKQLVQLNQNTKASDLEIIKIEMNRGMELCNENRFREAIDPFLTILSVYPDSLETRYYTALMYIKLNDYIAAIQHLTYISKVMENEPDDFQAEIWSVMGICYSHIQAFHSAIDAFHKSAKLNPYLRLREILSLKGGIQKTIERLSELYHELGSCYSEMHNDFRVEEMYMKALEFGMDQTTVGQALDKVRERIHRMKKDVVQIHQNQPKLSPPLVDQSITWLQSASYPLEDSEEIIQERRKRWAPYFINGNRVLEMEWQNQTDLHENENEIEQTYDGLLLLFRGSSIAASDLLNMCKQCFKWINHTGKIIILMENQDHASVSLSAKTILETILNSADWIVKETNKLQNENSFYIVSQKTSYEVLWQCPLFNSSGYSEEQKHFLDGIRPYPLRVKVQSMVLSQSDKLYSSDMEMYLSALQKQRITTPLIHYQAAPANHFMCPVAPISIGRTMFETDSLPANWVESLNEITEVWVPSEFNRDTFASAGVNLERIQVIPGTLDENKYNPVNARPYSLTGTGSFMFLSVFDWSIRKAWDILLRAYFEEFSQNDNVSLILKVTQINEPNTSPYSKLKDLAKKLGLRKLPHVHIIQTNMSEEEMIGLYAAVDCFVLPSRGEGWGRPYMEAMAMELPTIGTKWSGQQAFMDDDNSYLIDVEGLVPVDQSMPPHFHGHRWAEPSVDHLKALMRHVYNHRSEAKQKGRKARKDLFPRFSRHTIGQQIFERMDELVKYYYT